MVLKSGNASQPASPYAAWSASPDADSSSATLVSIFHKSGDHYLEIKPYAKHDPDLPGIGGFQPLQKMLVKQPYETVRQAIEKRFKGVISLEATLLAPEYLFSHITSQVPYEQFSQDIVDFCVKELTPHSRP